MIINQNYINEHRNNANIIDELLDNNPKDSISHIWLKESLPKRIIYYELYSDFILNGNKKILDIGGGYCGITKTLALENDYTLLDICNSDIAINHIQKDWYDIKNTKESYDVIIANDIFPNVDQRLEMFLYYFLPKCKEMRLSLTYYDNYKFYKTKRIDGDEIFHQLEWNSEQTEKVMKKYKKDIKLPYDKSVFPNGRQIYITTIRGNNYES